MKHLLLHLTVVRNIVVGTEQNDPSSGLLPGPLRSPQEHGAEQGHAIRRGLMRITLLKLGWKYVHFCKQYLLGFHLYSTPLRILGKYRRSSTCFLWIEDLLHWKKNPSCGGVDGSWRGTSKGEGLQTGPLAPVGCDFNGVRYYFSFMLNCLLVFFSVGMWESSLSSSLCRPCVWEGPMAVRSRHVSFSQGPRDPIGVGGFPTWCWETCVRNSRNFRKASIWWLMLFLGMTMGFIKAINTLDRIPVWGNTTSYNPA